MLQRPLIKFDKTVFLRKYYCTNDLIMCIVVHETRRQKLLFGMCLFYCINDNRFLLLCYIYLWLQILKLLRFIQ